MMAKTIERAAEYLGSLERCRQAVAEFYQACADTWPAERTFWQRLADEEAAVAVRIEMLRARVQRTPHGVGLMHPYPPEVIGIFIKNVENDTRVVRSAGMSPEIARVRARDLAQSLIMSQPLRGFSFDDPRFFGYRVEISAQIVASARQIVGGRRPGGAGQSQAA